MYIAKSSEEPRYLMDPLWKIVELKVKSKKAKNTPKVNRVNGGSLNAESSIHGLLPLAGIRRLTVRIATESVTI